jgi:hypothetical protein
VTRVETGPHDDQAAAKQRDLLRLGDLLTAHFTDDPPPPHPPILARMTPADRAEATAIFERLGDSSEAPEITRARQESLLSLARVETEALDILKHGHPRIRNGKVLYDPQTGQPLRNRNIDRSARALLRRVQRDRARIAGLPPPTDDETPA